MHLTQFKKKSEERILEQNEVEWTGKVQIRKE